MYLYREQLHDWQERVQPALPAHGGGGGVPRGNSEAQPGLGGQQGACGQGQLVNLVRVVPGVGACLPSDVTPSLCSSGLPTLPGEPGAPVQLPVGLWCSGISSRSTSPLVFLTEMEKPSLEPWPRLEDLSQSEWGGGAQASAEGAQSQPSLLGTGFQPPCGVAVLPRLDLLTQP